jgi:pyrimidine deaminase RibD-like protein
LWYAAAGGKLIKDAALVPCMTLFIDEQVDDVFLAGVDQKVAGQGLAGRC